jgi:hypothetical protein
MVPGTDRASQPAAGGRSDPLAYTYEVVEDESHRLVMRTAQGRFPMETTYT